jgi:hypothetical protein
MPKRIWHKVERTVTSDGAGLAALGGAALVRAVSYTPGNVDVNRAPAHWLESLLPVQAWAVVWLFIAAACLVAIITPRLMPIAVGLSVALNFFWALSFIGIWLLGESPRGYVSALGYGTVAYLTVWGFGRSSGAVIPVRIEKE